MKVVHPLKPIYNSESKVLILGSFPSIKSRENSFYYAHPKNRFWSTLEKVFKEDIRSSNQDREKFLLTHKIALFDVVYSCNITASRPASYNLISISIASFISVSCKRVFKVRYTFTPLT